VIGIWASTYCILRKWQSDQAINSCVIPVAHFATNTA
jgi:hypothetical protein